MKEQLAYERAMGTGGRSGEDWDCWQAVYGPIGENGYFQPLFDPATGTIDHGVAAYWKEHTDLNAYLQRRWKEIGPKLAGKIHIWTGDMDTYYLNDAVHLTRGLPEDDQLAAVGRLDHLRPARAPLLDGTVHAGGTAADDRRVCRGPIPEAVRPASRAARGDRVFAKMPPQDELRIAVLVPCYNEETAIGKVVRDFRAALPTATVYVYDNESIDDSAAIAAEAGAAVRHEHRRGKGNVVRRMFQDIEADVYVMVDGDDTYDAAIAPALVERLVADNLDMVVGRRIETHRAAYRGGHRLGQRRAHRPRRWLFDAPIGDMLSGYRVFSRRFVKSFPSFSREFEIETELTVHAMQMRMPVAEVDTTYKERPPGSASKLRTFRDGGRILLTIMNLVRNERPLLFFSLVGLIFLGTALVLGLPAVRASLSAGVAPRVSTAILCTGLVVIAVLCVATGSSSTSSRTSGARSIASPISSTPPPPRAGLWRPPPEKGAGWSTGRADRGPRPPRLWKPRTGTNSFISSSPGSPHTAPHPMSRFLQ